MKKRSLLWCVYALALTLVMYNCKKKEEPFPLEPDAEIGRELAAIDVKPVTLVQPAAVPVTAGSVEVSAKAAAVAGDMAELKNGTIPASVQTATSEVSAALSTSEIGALEAVSASDVAAVAAGGTLPANLRAVMDKAAANPALQAYMPKVTLPTVNGATVSGRSGVIEGAEGVEGVEGIEVEDACVQAGQAAYEAVKTKLLATKAAEIAKVTAAYNTSMAGIPGEETACQAGVPAKYATLRTAAQTQATQALADLEAAKSVLPAQTYAVLKAFVNIQLLGVLSSLNTLQAAELKACSETTAAKTAANTAARDANLAAVEANYQEALAAADAKKAELIQSCHNQGGGN